jgi:hypothetical protein
LYIPKTSDLDEDVEICVFAVEERIGRGNFRQAAECFLYVWANPINQKSLTALHILLVAPASAPRKTPSTLSNRFEGIIEPGAIWEHSKELKQLEDSRLFLARIKVMSRNIKHF